MLCSNTSGTQKGKRAGILRYGDRVAAIIVIESAASDVVLQNGWPLGADVSARHASAQRGRGI